MEPATVIDGMGIDEACVRHVVAEQLGVDVDALATEVSLTDELAADSLDLLELALALEDAIGVAVSDRLGNVRTYGDLLRALARARADGRSAGDFPWESVAVRARLIAGSGGPALERSGTLTPYEMETIREDARRLGPGARLELVLVGAADVASERWLCDSLAPLEAYGIDVSLRREGGATGLHH